MKKPDQNAKEALEEMKLEVSKEVATRIFNGGIIGGKMTRRLVEMGKKEFLDRKGGH